MRYLLCLLLVLCGSVTTILADTVPAHGKKGRDTDHKSKGMFKGKNVVMFLSDQVGNWVVNMPFIYLRHGPVNRLLLFLQQAVQLVHGRLVRSAMVMPATC